ncbi:hypothetical protein [Mangrovimonas sp. TPBH4]|uniref:hypothetical protein n=1 Tax=Mangrovimonas sp. TPBH4 TaxID=1645914 RepID=UPI000A634961|nr:hypothetical protein [Mangrovimonas sp. TPBH4]
MKTQLTTPRKLLFVSRWGEILEIAYAASLKGNKVKMCIEDKDSRDIGFGADIYI